jgi:hypothetical protein
MPLENPGAAIVARALFFSAPLILNHVETNALSQREPQDVRTSDRFNSPSAWP